eukprot:TRINITY_DN11678_c0_g8_i1.p1 TRINITY_DN11678_c0_g8~~TRINITY_DN11678_c0_g8_i1.p1  ORF type:complete len:604 (-),score=114.23 TRINITY_DN11678_c0_g8_i1:126-1883(-)
MVPPPSRLVVASFALVVACLGGVEALELTPENWDERVVGRTLFLKFYAPWCGHCKKIKPDWEKLMSQFKSSPSALVAEVDCTGKGKPLCEKNGVASYPTIKWGKPDELQMYTGARNFAEFKKFADEHLGRSCGPGDLDLCDEKRKGLFEKFMRIAPEKLEAKIKVAEQQKHAAERNFQIVEHNMSLQIQAAEQKRNDDIAAIKESKGLPKGPAPGSMELTPETWEEHVGDKSIFVKFFAPWCGHCKAIKHDWDKLISDYAGTRTVLVAEVDCTGSGKELCDTHKITGFPRLLWGKPDNLQVYSGERNYKAFKKFAEDILGKRCSPNDIDLCDEKRKAVMQKLSTMSPEKREAKDRAAQKAIKKAEQAYDDAQWNFTLEIDLAEQAKIKHIKAIEDQGLSEAKQVHAWNKKQPPGFWKPPADLQPTRFAFLQDVIFEVGGVQVTTLTILLVTLSIVGSVLFYGSTPPEESVRCKVRHILVKDKEGILKAKARIEAGEDFEDVCKECSSCPSAKEGGDLGVRVPGAMDPAVEKACFDPKTKIGSVVGPVESKFGFHLLIVDERHGVDEGGDASSSKEKKTDKEKKNE